jgi:sigma-B regulation protein RsbU (phosphoserine phosphatase)
MAESSDDSEDVRLGSGDLLCLYSDGINECFSPDWEQSGLDRLEEVLRESRSAPLTDIIERIEGAITDFASAAPQSDDQTVVLLRRTNS